MKSDTYIPLMCALSAGFFILGASVGGSNEINVAGITSNFSNIAVGAASAVACYVGIVGLSKWKSELKGNDHHELAKRVLQSAYRLREAVKTVRNPIFFPNEFPSEYPLNYPPKTTESERIKNETLKYSAAYQKRLELLTTAWIELYELRVEVETLWGQNSVDILDEFAVMMHHLRGAVEHKVSALADGVPFDDPVLNFKIDSLGQDETKFGQDINEAVKNIETHVKGHIYK